MRRSELSLISEEYIGVSKLQLNRGIEGINGLTERHRGYEYFHWN